MSRDQKPGRSKIVTDAAPRAVAASSLAATPDQASASLPTGSAARGNASVYVFAVLFLVACTAGGVGVALLPWLTR